MQHIRRWEIDHSVPFDFQIASDARFSRTDYTDDQVWTVKLGEKDNPALAFQTQFGGRAGLASLVPMWILEGRTVYQFQTYSTPPIFTHFAPGYLRAEGKITPELDLVAHYWSMESRAAGGEFFVTNTGDTDVNLRIDLFGHVAINGRDRKLNVLTFRDDSIALHLGQIGNINPVAVLEGSTLSIYGGHISSPKIGSKWMLPPGTSVHIPFVVAGLAEMRDSVSLAMNWLARPWKPFFEQIDLEARTIPKIYTGNDEWDKVLDLSFTHVVNSFMKATNSLPNASYVGARASNRGWSKRGDGADHMRAWAGQDPTLAYLLVPIMASIEPDFAKGIIRNYLSTQDDSGFIDRQPGLAGQRQGAMMMPILARMAWAVYQHTEDDSFLEEIFAKLSVFFKRWFNHDMDADSDGVPEWQSERQLGYIAFPTFAMGQPWGQGANIRQMETPDLLAYLISEADALRDMANQLGEDDKTFTDQLEQLEAKLEEFWDGERYTYRDRDSHITTGNSPLLNGVAGDEEHRIEASLIAPNRVIIRVVGGVSHRPKITLHLHGRDKDDRPVQLKAESDDFLWLNRQGMYTTSEAFSKIDSIKIDGLSRVYKIYADTVDSSRFDINHLLPLWTGRLSKDHAKSLVKFVTDKNHFLRPNGITMVSAEDKDFDPSNANGGGGIWMYWLSLIGEGLVKSGYRKEAVSVVKSVLDMLTTVINEDGHISQFYNSDVAQGYGEDGYVGGVAPLNLLMEAIGVRIVSHRKVWVGGEHVWGRNISVEQHGVTVKRAKKSITVSFPSGHEVKLDGEADWQMVLDPEPIQETVLEEPEQPEIPNQSESDSTKRVMIEVEGDAPAVEPPDEDSDESPADSPEIPSDDPENVDLD